MYRSIVLDAKFTLAPVGRNAESYRLWEAAEAGSVPVVVLGRQYERMWEDCKNGLHPLMWSKAPFIWADNWQSAFEKMLALNSNAKELAQRQDDLLDWYHGYMRSLCGTFERELASVMAGTLKLDAHWSA